MSTVDVNSVIVTGENSVIRLNNNDNDAFTTQASFWRILTCPAGPGDVLYLKNMARLRKTAGGSRRSVQKSRALPDLLNCASATGIAGSSSSALIAPTTVDCSQRAIAMLSE